MLTTPRIDLRIDAASAISLGARARQEDALATSFPQGANIGFAVLSDGMGGHAAGDLASRIIVTEVFAELTMRLGHGVPDSAAIPRILHRAMKIANHCVKAHIEDHPEAYGMGGTLVVAVSTGEALYWLSVGDSPLYLFRDRQLVRLNDDHSMAPQIDLMVREGLMDAETGRNHPQRSCLTSALIGEDVSEVDCPETPFELRDGDLVLVASDGIQFLTEDGIGTALRRTARGQSARIADELMTGLEALGDPDQDNTSLVVIKASCAETGIRAQSAVSLGALRRAISGAVAPVCHLIMRSG